MIIEFPPTNLPGSLTWFIRFDQMESLSDFCRYFRDEDFDDRYFSQLDWFKDMIPRVESILNVGCATGRETFALMWKLNASVALGIDTDESKISSARKVAQFRHWFHDEILVSVLDQRGVQSLRDWNEEWVPLPVRKGIVPEFVKVDISEGIAELGHTSSLQAFDLVYCRYVLWQVAERGGVSSLQSTCQNIAHATKQESGRVVVVEPTRRGTREYDFAACLQNAGLVLERVEEDANRLGWLEDPETDPMGYIFKSETRET